MQEDKSFLGTQPIKKLLPKLAVPTVIAQLVNMLYNIVDRIYIGHIPEVGSLALTGIGVCMPLILIVSAFSAFVASGGAPRASIFMGRGDGDSAEKTLGGCLTMQVIISLLLTAAMLIWKDELLYLFGASENTISYAADYMGIYALGTIFVQITLGLNSFITAQGFAKVGMKTVIIGAVRDYEPMTALDGGEDGLDFYRAIIKYWTITMRPNGLMMFEVGEGQADEVKMMLLKAGFVSVEGRNDTLGFERVVIGKWKNEF